MFAVVEINKNQYVVKNNQEIIVDKLEAQDKNLEIKNVLLYKDDHKVLFGKPYIKDASVSAEIIKEKKGEKIVVFKYKRRKGYKKRTGHRQLYTVLKIKEIKVA